jgi:putative heme-binding domain-containing protein
MLPRFFRLFLLLSLAPCLRASTPADQIQVADGFKVELLKSATPAEGSWVSMAIDPKGRLYLSPQGAVPESGFKPEDRWGGLWRATLDAAGGIVRWEKVEVPVGSSMGMLWAFDSLYVSGQGPDGQAIYRLRDTNADDALDSWSLLKKVPGGEGEHGAHALVLGPDRESIYIAHGNSTPLVEGITPDSPYRHHAEDSLLPRVLDPVATFFDKLKAPYGHILRTDESGSVWELVAAGLRNQYDIDFNADGELFTYDSDMEWDRGLPWYRPTRVLHLIPGGEYGFREGSDKWPESYVDSLPAAVDIGLGCPTGVKFGTHSHFPTKYRQAFFIMDWTFGRILAVHLKPRGATYKASHTLRSYTAPTGPEAGQDVEVFLQGKGLPVTDLEFGRDGAMYFIVGGRGTQSALYRVSHAKPANMPQPPLPVAISPELAALRSLGAHQTANSPERLETAWKHLDSPDRFVAFSARAALEAQTVDAWRDRALAEKNPHNALMALLALTRSGDTADQPAVLKALAQFPLEDLDEQGKLAKLRVITLSLARHGLPTGEAATRVIGKLMASYPAGSFALNRELAPILIWLTNDRSEGKLAVAKTFDLLEKAPTQEEQVWFAYCLRAASASSWPDDLRRRFFQWFAKAQTYKGGNSFTKFILRIRDLALAQAPADQRASLAELTEKPAAPAIPAAPPRSFVKAWTVAELEPKLSGAASGRNFERGRNLYTATQCAACHQFAGEGGSIGPDLSGIAGRFSRRDILEAIIEPSKALSEQYASYLITTKKGDLVAGQIIEENNDHLIVLTDPLSGATQLVGQTQIATREISPVSLMPPALLNTCTEEEVLDLLAYLESGGNPESPAFK